MTLVTDLESRISEVSNAEKLWRNAFSDEARSVHKAGFHLKNPALEHCQLPSRHECINHFQSSCFGK